MTTQTDLRSLARLLILIGAVLLILGGILGLANARDLIDLTPTVRGLGLLAGALVGILVGVLALMGSAKVESSAWNIILLVLGLFVGSLGGVLVFIGALVALVATFVKT